MIPNMPEGGSTYARGGGGMGSHWLVHKPIVNAHTFMERDIQTY